MAEQPKNAAEYLAGLDADRRKALTAVRRVINQNLPKGYKEGVQYGMIGWSVPHSVYPAGYHCDPRQPLPFLSIASQKNHMAIYLFCVYTDPGLLEWFTASWKKTGRKLDMGKSCLRFKKLEDLDLNLLGELVSRVPVDAFIAAYESAFVKRGKPEAKKTVKKSAKKAVAKKASAKKVAKKVAKKASGGRRV